MQVRVLVSAIGLSCATLMWSVPAALAATTTFLAVLNGANDGTPSLGSGTATVVLNTDAHTLLVAASFSGLTTNSVAAHIHCCQTTPGTPAAVGVATMQPAFTGFPLGVTSGTYPPTLFDLTQASFYNAPFLAAHGGTPAGAEAALTAALLSGLTYFNIHTTMFSGGEIRGQLNVVPLPAALPLFATGLGALGLLAWRRKRKDA